MQGTSLSNLVALMGKQSTSNIPTTVGGSTQQKTMESSITTTSPSVFTQADIDQSALGVKQAAQQYKAVAAVGAEEGQKAVGNIIKEAEKAKQEQGKAKDSKIAEFGTELNQQLAVNQRTAKTLKALENHLDNPETQAVQRMADENLTETSRKLMEAQQQLRNGGPLDLIVGAFKTDFYSRQVNNAQDVTQGLNAQQAQLTQQYMQQLAADASIAGAPYADELARTQYITKESTVLYEKAINNIAIDKESMAALGQSLSLSGEEVKALTTELNAIVTANNANQSLITQKIQEASLRSMLRKEQQEVKSADNEAAFFAYRNQQLQSFMAERGLDSAGMSYETLLAAAQTEGPVGGTPDILDAFLAHVNSVESRPKSALSRYAYSIEAQQEPDMLSISAKTFYDQERNRMLSTIQADEAAKWQARQPKDSELSSPTPGTADWENMQKEIKRRTDELTIYKEDGTVNPKALAYWDKQFAAATATVNQDASSAIQDGLVSFRGVELNLQSPEFMNKVMSLLPADTQSALKEGVKPPLNLEQGKPVSGQLSANLNAFVYGLQANGNAFDNNYTTAAINHAAKYMAAAYSTHRQTQREAMPNMIRTVVKVTDFGSLSEINLEDEQSLKLALQHRLMEYRKSELPRRTPGILSAAITASKQ